MAVKQSEEHCTALDMQYLAVGSAEADTRKFEAGAEEHGVSSMSVSLPQPARTMFFAT